MADRIGRQTPTESTVIMGSSIEELPIRLLRMPLLPPAGANPFALSAGRNRCVAYAPCSC